jgi:hypothetical protein
MCFQVVRRPVVHARLRSRHGPGNCVRYAFQVRYRVSSAVRVRACGLKSVHCSGVSMSSGCSGPALPRSITACGSGLCARVCVSASVHAGSGPRTCSGSPASRWLHCNQHVAQWSMSGVAGFRSRHCPVVHVQACAQSSGMWLRCSPRPGIAVLQVSVHCLVHVQVRVCGPGTGSVVQGPACPGPVHAAQWVPCPGMPRASRLWLRWSASSKPSVQHVSAVRVRCMFPVLRTAFPGGPVVQACAAQVPCTAPVSASRHASSRSSRVSVRMAQVRGPWLCFQVRCTCSRRS